jgi:hypothetical protein
LSETKRLASERDNTSSTLDQGNGGLGSKGDMSFVFGYECCRALEMNILNFSG